MPTRDGRPLCLKIMAFNIEDLVRAKTPVETSRGTLYARGETGNDWKAYGSDDLEILGKEAVRHLAGRSAEKLDSTPLDEEDFEELTPTDVDAIADAIAAHNEWDNIPAGSKLAGLGQLVKASRAKQVEEMKRQHEALLASVEKKYPFLKDGPLHRLQDHVLGLSSIRNGWSAKAVTEALRAAGGLDPSVSPLASTRAAADVARMLDGPTPNIRTPKVEFPKPYIPPMPEETPIGKATIQSAQNLQVVAENIETLTDLMGGLHNSVVMEVLPQWFKEVEEGQKNTIEAAHQAARGIKWAQVAVYASIVGALFITGGFTWWQVAVARDIDEGNTKQQAAATELLRQQLAVQKQLIEKQAAEFRQLRDALADLQKSQPIVAKK